LRLELSPEVFAACRPDLADLRIVDGAGRSVPCVLDRGPPRRAPRTRIETFVPRLLRAARQQLPGVDTARVLRETYELEAPRAARAGSAWELCLYTDAPHFVRQLDVASLAANGTVTPLLEQDSVFRLQAGHGERTRVELDFPPGARLRVTLTGETTTPLEPRFVFEAVEALPPERFARVPLVPRAAAAATEHQLELVRPSGIVPLALSIETQSPAFDRQIEVRDLGPGAEPLVLGSGRVFRIPGQPVVEQLDIHIEAASGHLLGVSIQDGDSPPLEALVVNALVRIPSLVFSLPEGAVARAPLTLFFGGARARAPRYDLAALLSEAHTAGASPDERTRRAYDSAGLPTVQLGPITDNPAFDRAPALGFALRAGATVDARLYQQQRRLELVPSSDGLAEVSLVAADLAQLRGDWGDLRVVDAVGQQWPYLLERGRETETVSLLFHEPLREGRVSRTALTLPVSSVSANALLLDIEEPYFDRAYELTAEGVEGQPIALSHGRLLRSADSPPGPLVLELPLVPVRSLSLRVEDGDNEPLAFRAIRARVPVPALYVLAPAGSYRLLLGNPSALPPAYDIAAASELVLSVASHPSHPEPLEPNPLYRSSARLVSGDGPGDIALWAVLAFAVVVLGGLTLRLVRRSSAAPP